MTNLASSRIRVLVVDDSPLMRHLLSKGLSADPGIEVVGCAGDPYQARDLLLQLQPDLMTLDVQMPRMNGLDFLRRLIPQHPLPVIMVSALTQAGADLTLDCLAAGAMDFICKPSRNTQGDIDTFLAELRGKICTLAQGPKPAARCFFEPAARTAPPRVAPAANLSGRLIAIGASTGGTEAIKKVVMGLPRDIPGVVVVQHMPAGFTKAYADRLNEECPLEVREAISGDVVRQGTVLIAPGGLHMTVQREGGGFKVHCAPGEKVNWHCPSVDVLMHSVAQQAGAGAVGVMLTGMGNDGAAGMLAMRRAGSRTLAQDEASSVVFGMPKVAFDCGGAERLLPLEQIAGVVVGLLKGGTP